MILKERVFEKELELIENDRIRDFAIRAIKNLPDYFFTIPASAGKYHPRYARTEGGLVRHTRAAVKIANELLKLEMFSNKFSDDTQDLIYLALLCHDGIKRGEKGGKYATPNHPVLAANYILDINSDGTLNPDEEKIVHDAIISHMGQWNKDRSGTEIMPKPKSAIQKFVHICDYLASRQFLLFDFGDDYYELEDFTE